MLRTTHPVVTFTFLILLVTACAESARENIVDPVVAPTIEMSAPVLDGGTIVIEWRYLAQGDAAAEFLVFRIVDGEAAEIGRATATCTPASRMACQCSE